MLREIELIFPDEFDSRGEYEAEQRGLLDNVKLRLDRAHLYRLCFFTPSRISVELNLINQAGEPCMAEPGMIVVAAVTRSDMRDAVEFLAQSRYFERLMPENTE